MATQPTWETVETARAAARGLGGTMGANAASYYFDGHDRVTHADYVKVLQGINDGDPETMDTLPGSPLSGEFSGDYTPQKLLNELDLDGYELTEAVEEAILEDFESAFTSAVQSGVENECLVHLRRNVQFEIVVTTDRDAKVLLNAIEDLLAQQDCDLHDSSFEDEDA